MQTYTCNDCKKIVSDSMKVFIDIKDNTYYCKDCEKKHDNLIPLCILNEIDEEDLFNDNLDDFDSTKF